MADPKSFIKDKKTKKKAKAFVKDHKMKKSIDFDQSKVSIDSNDQKLAETANPALINYLKAAVQNDLSKIPFVKGMLTLSQKEPGLFSGFFSNLDGQVVENFHDQTIELVAKNMEIKQLYAFSPTEPSVAVQSPNPPTAQDTALAAHDRIDMVHRRIDELEKQPIKDVKSLRVRFGDFELELRKSLKDFVHNFKKSQSVNGDLVRKAVHSWRRKHKENMDLPNDSAAAREIFENWEEHQEGFSQIVYALQQVEKENG